MNVAKWETVLRLLAFPAIPPPDAGKPPNHPPRHLNYGFELFALLGAQLGFMVSTILEL